MPSPNDLPDLERLAAFFRYNAVSGELSIFRRSGWRLVEPTPGCRYLTVHFDGRRLYAHRIAWKLHYSVEPPSIIDHIDRCKSNNKIDNLREATHSLNMFNRDAKPHLHRGIFFDRKRNWFRARITVGERRKCLGYFRTADEAADAYRRAAEKLARSHLGSQEA